MHAVRRTVADTTRRLVSRFYNQFWNGRNYDVAERLMAPRGVLRGTLGATSQGPEGLVTYARRLLDAFPDVEMHVGDLIVERDRAAAHIWWTGTHRGEALGCAATGRRVRYDCVALFRVAHGRIAEVEVHGDRSSLQDQLCARRPRIASA